MARSPRQALKLLYLKRFFELHTDLEHYARMEDILNYLQENGIACERKSIYTDIDWLREFSMDIQFVRGKSGGYYLARREFETAEVRLLVDSMQSNRFLTERKTRSIIEKLQKLTSMYEADALTAKGQVIVQGRIKSMNESVLYSVDTLTCAIADNKRVNFRYFDFSVERRKVFRHDGREYDVSPYALICDSDNYHMVGYDTQEKKIKHYRVDRMDGIKKSDYERLGKDAFKELDMSAYTRRNFSMYHGEPAEVTMQFDNSLIGVVMDRFGKDVAITKSGKQSFRITVTVNVSDQFYGWLFGLGNRVRILSPKSVIKGYRDMLNAVLETCEN